MIKTSTPADTDTGAAIIAQLLTNDKQNLTQDENAVLNSGISEGMVVKWSPGRSKWLLCDGTVALSDTDSIGIVTYADGTSGQVKTSGVYVNDELSTVGKYYCQSDGSIGTTITKVFIGNITSPGRLCLPGGSGGGGNIATATSLGQVMIGDGIKVDSQGKIYNSHNVQIFSTPGTYTWTCPAGVTSVLATVIGAGGGGAGGAYLNNTTVCPNGGGGGNIIRDFSIPVTPGTDYAITVGAGGNGGAATKNGVPGINFGNNGEASSFGSTLYASGGLADGTGALIYGYSGNSQIILNSGQSQTTGSVGGRGGGLFGGSAGNNSTPPGNGGLGSGGGGAAGKYDNNTPSVKTGGNGGPGMVMLVY